jgi:hypothetical protein
MNNHGEKLGVVGNSSVQKTVIISILDLTKSKPLVQSVIQREQCARAYVLDKNRCGLTKSSHRVESFFISLLPCSDIDEGLLKVESLLVDQSRTTQLTCPEHTRGGGWSSVGFFSR